MERYERINLLHRRLSQARVPVPAQRLMDDLQCSRATVYRDVAFLRDCLGAPVETSEEPPGFRYDLAEAERWVEWAASQGVVPIAPWVTLAMPARPLIGAVTVA